MIDPAIRDRILAILFGLVTGAAGLSVGGVNANDQAELRMVAIDGMSRALAEQVRECQKAVAQAYHDGLEDAREGTQ